MNYEINYETFNASAAKSVAEKALSETEVRSVLDEVFKYANSGQFEVRIEFSLHSYTIKSLKEKGFYVDRTDSSTRYNYVINWK